MAPAWNDRVVSSTAASGTGGGAEPGAPTRPPLLRPKRGRWVGGVATGIALHLRVRVTFVRLAFLAATLAGGMGVVAYVFWWFTIPAGDPTDPRTATPPAWRRLAKPLEEPGGEESGTRFDPLRTSTVVIALSLLAVAALLLVDRLGGNNGWLIPALLLVVAVALVWGQWASSRQAGSPQGAHNGAQNGAPEGRGLRVIRLVGGVAIAAIAIVLFVGQDAQPTVVLQSALAAIAVLAGVALVLAPWWLGMVRALADERAARERESERADIAAHLHDSVLQTLSIIRARSSDPEVVRLARAQERDLRQWLYEDRSPAATSVAAQVKEMVAEVEDTRTHADGSPADIEAVVVGDAVPTEETTALLRAMREALLNAVAHGRPPVSVYVEADPTAVEAVVRDHGDGFDLAAIPEDRFGVRESILGRVRRRAGKATITTLADGGTEVHLEMPLDPSGGADPGSQTSPEENERTEQS
ncbi:phage shock protein C (PspC) family protein [Serinibacter salmoneus]|uniref:Phage shock protein C (PspC) family protein n=1 Tax=Serinibacter salmoneus TaxID=556530 RepID=A0A2A9CZI1_9MICO|nr:phage shock protein C (PspC) family protein [Serinibacter salmoneus]